MKSRVAQGICTLLALAMVVGCSPETEEAKLDREEMPPPKIYKRNPDEPPPRDRGAEARKNAIAKANAEAAGESAAPGVGMMAPDIEGPDTDGVDFKLSDYRGKVVMLDFWGNW